jgi:hypothetical protein
MTLPSARAFLAWKDGDDPGDCQDSIYCPKSFAPGPFAVADGAATSFFSRAWATILTRRFGSEPQGALSDWHQWLQLSQAEWQQEVQEAASSENASFLVKNGVLARRPAAAAFAAVLIEERNSEGWAWRSIVIGDSCLFRLGHSGAIQTWHLKSSEDFSSVVRAVESWPKAENHFPAQFGSPPYGCEPVLVEKDTLFLATDALSKWLLTRYEQGAPVWATLASLDSHDKFEAFVSSARKEAVTPLDNDDVALVVLRFGDLPPSFNKDVFEPNPRKRLTPNEPNPIASVSKFESDSRLFDPASNQGEQTLSSSRVERWRASALLFVSLFLLVVCLGLSIVAVKSRRANRRLRAQNGVLESVIGGLRKELAERPVPPQRRQVEAENIKLSEELEFARRHLETEKPAFDQVIPPDGNDPRW